MERHINKSKETKKMHTGFNANLYFETTSSGFVLLLIKNSPPTFLHKCHLIYNCNYFNNLSHTLPTVFNRHRSERYAEAAFFSHSRTWFSSLSVSSNSKTTFTLTLISCPTSPVTKGKLRRSLHATLTGEEGKWCNCALKVLSVQS